jgi:hypothetical protein
MDKKRDKNQKTFQNQNSFEAKEKKKTNKKK